MLLVLPSAAGAKEVVVSAKLCGPSGCRETTDREVLLAFHERGLPTDPPATAVAFYRAEIVVQGHGAKPSSFDLTVMPDVGLVRGEDGTWMPVSPGAVAQYRRLARNLDPFPAAKLGGLTAPGPEATEPAVDDGPFWPWIAGGLVALTALGLLSVPRLRSGRRRV